MNAERRRVSGVSSPFDPVTGRGIVDDHEAVDFGLPSGLLWATKDIGAHTELTSLAIFNSGVFFKYGGTAGWTYNNSTGKFTTTDTFTNKSVSDYNEHTLTSTEDAAKVKWGNGWRMPTKAEYEELLNNCTANYLNSGRRVQSPSGEVSNSGWYGYAIYKGSYKQTAPSYVLDFSDNPVIFFPKESILTVDSNGTGSENNYICPVFRWTSTYKSNRYGTIYSYIFSNDNYMYNTYNTIYPGVEYTETIPSFTSRIGMRIRPVHDPI